jgi:uncharacterized protein
MEIVGRTQEIKLLQRLKEDRESSFLAVYGRRRIGKTYLVRQFFAKSIVFECSGLHQKEFSQQLENFWLAINEAQPANATAIPPKSWLQAFSLLKSCLNRLEGPEKKVVFLDEISWFETPRSGFLAALDNFWNQYCTKRDDIILVICGSAASWIIQKVINDRGGLHNRITHRLQLLPFTLKETQAYLASRHVKMDTKDLALLYMCIGGIPFYLKDVQSGWSTPQILDHLCLGPQAILKNEFQNLYASLFKNHALHEKIVAALASKNKGLTRNELIKVAETKSGGDLTLALDELQQCGFVKIIYPINKKKEDCLFRLMDEFSLFYYKFLQQGQTNNSWALITEKQSFKVWAGYAFENLCFKHIPQIKQALGISGVVTNEYSYVFKGDEYHNGVQIDLMIERADNCINMLELKFHNKEFVISKAYEQEMREKVATFKNRAKLRKGVFVTMLSVYGVAKNQHYLSVVNNQIMLDDLFT